MTEELDPLNPSLALLAKLGSLVVHIEEYMSPTGHDFDRQAILTGLQDDDLQSWLDQMTMLQFVPVRRDLKSTAQA